MTQPVAGPRFADTIPYDTPESLEDLEGPTGGVVEVGHHIDTSPRPSDDLADPAQEWSLYSRVVRDGLVRDQVRLLNRDRLVRLWAQLLLPARCRAVWEAKFPDLASRTA